MFCCSEQSNSDNKIVKINKKYIPAVKKFSIKDMEKYVNICYNTVWHYVSV